MRFGTQVQDGSGAGSAPLLAAVLIVSLATSVFARQSTYTQPMDCSFSANVLGYYSNTNSALEPWITRDDFVAPATGPLNRVSIWAVMLSDCACGFCDLTNIDGLQVDIFEATSATCGGFPVNVVCSY